MVFGKTPTLSKAQLNIVMEMCTKENTTTTKGMEKAFKDLQTGMCTKESSKTTNSMEKAI